MTPAQGFSLADRQGRLANWSEVARQCAMAHSGGNLVEGLADDGQLSP
jgi:hypothetical protein